MLFPPQNLEEAFFQCRITFEFASFCQCYGLASRFFNASHGHTHMLCFQHNYNALGLHMGHQCIGNLVCQLFLKLQPPGKYLSLRHILRANRRAIQMTEAILREHSVN